MKTYKSQEEFVAEIKDNVFISKESIDISAFKLNLDIQIEVAGDINAWNIKAGNINAGDIKAGDINAWDINARDIKAWNINARDINARDIKAWDINAKIISYYGVAFAYQNIKAQAIHGRRGNAKHFVLDGTIDIKDDTDK